MNGLSAAANCLGQYFAQFAALLDPTEVAQVELLSYKLEHRVIEIAVFGLVSTGKTTLLNALLGKKIGATSPLNGTTQGLATQTWSIKAGQGKAQIRFIDTPG
ncbi:MAG: GTPase, partial [Pseudanabaenaceae cyanobacterium]